MLRSKNHLFLGKGWLFDPNPSFPRDGSYFTARPIFPGKECVSFVVCACYELMLPIRFVGCHYYWDSILLAIILYNR